MKFVSKLFLQNTHKQVFEILVYEIVHVNFCAIVLLSVPVQICTYCNSARNIALGIGPSQTHQFLYLRRTALQHLRMAEGRFDFVAIRIFGCCTSVC